MGQVPKQAPGANRVGAKTGLTIGGVARAAGVGVETVRFYERRGLIEQPEKPMFGRRTYPPETVARIRFIRRAKDLGFTLKEIAELLDLRMDPGKSCAEVRARALAKMADIDRRIEALGRMRRALADLASACRGRGPTSECPILDAMEEGEEASVPAGQEARPAERNRNPTEVKP